MSIQEYIVEAVKSIDIDVEDHFEAIIIHVEGDNEELSNGTFVRLQSFDTGCRHQELRNLFNLPDDAVLPNALAGKKIKITVEVTD